MKDIEKVKKARQILELSQELLSCDDLLLRLSMRRINDITNDLLMEIAFESFPFQHKTSKQSVESKSKQV